MTRQEASAAPTVAILAGGLATRLQPLTNVIPKSMIPVGGDPFIAHQLASLARQDYRDVVICAGHLADQIASFVGDGAAFGCKLRYSLDGEQALGTGGAIRKALPLLGESFFVMYGDSYLMQPLAPVWQAFRQSRKAALMTILRNEGRWDASNVEFRGEEIIRYDKTGDRSGMHYIDYGVGCIRADAFSSWVNEGVVSEECFDLSRFYQDMTSKGELAAFEVKDRFYEIGSPQGLAETDMLIRQLHRREVDQ
ncbi:Nucleotidyl transferase [Acidisarcina polymorpha]|uniref:Nucleotidyl transferase n=1 Tax=Acidisarcina polymorpha TaxID=2211140 RepID=A0A2Z5FY53_9BACT|nr:sugar phosphate nucleotidyltransferase [Acidisarcina polymorpha]AXC11798.1 Nucleotidyl transferase [Acidisarcina polymorpha]